LGAKIPLIYFEEQYFLFPQRTKEQVFGIANENPIGFQEKILLDDSWILFVFALKNLSDCPSGALALIVLASTREFCMHRCIYHCCCHSGKLICISGNIVFSSIL